MEAGSLTDNVNAIVTSLFKVCPSPVKAQVVTLRDLTLKAITDRTAQEILNNNMVEHQKEARKKRTKKTCGEARVLTVKEIRKEAKKREEAEQELAVARERRAALKGKGIFAKLVWKELYMDLDLFH